ncbi:hypothetical protein LCGC14_1740040 [marine sediment metagenome]|uniref:Polyprenyl synthetase family protein n=1 Tax=marine sediment metagenome TaxID=412755 RepID=A0A0F9JM84_9ZZZZ
MNPGDKLRLQVEEEMLAILSKGSTPLLELESMYRYHMGFCDRDGKPVDVPKGKYMRPVLCLAMCAALGGDPEQAIPAAASLELGHRSSLIFDDIQDKGMERNGRPAVWTIWGAAQAINAGLVLSSFARIALLRLEERRVPTNTILATWAVLERANIDLCRGQFLDLSFMDGRSVGVAEYLDMVRGKTASFFAAACEVAALIASRDAPTVMLAREFGLKMGVAFQVHDDYLGVWGDEGEVGKTANDLVEKKRSLPMVLACEMAPGFPQVDRATLEGWLKSEGPRPEEAAVVKSFMEDIGVPTRLAEMERGYLGEATQVLDQLELQPEWAERLRSLLERVVERNL